MPIHALLALAVMLVNYGLVTVAAAGLAAATRPQNAVSWLVSGLFSAIFTVIVVSELAGRISYDGPAMLFGAFIAAILGAISLFLHRKEIVFVRPQRPVIGDWGARFALIFVVFWALIALYALAVEVLTVPVLVDSLRYHLAAPAHWHAQGHIGPVPGADYRVNHFPHAAGLLFGWSIAAAGTDLFGGVFAVLIAFLLWPGVVFLIARRLGAAPQPALIAAICSGMVPTVVLQGVNEGVDVLFWAAGLMTLYLAVIRDSGFKRLWLIIGMTAGIALATKSFGMVIAALGLTIWLFHALWRRRHDGSGAIIATLAAGIGAGLVALAAGIWVYGYNFLAFGNPLYPYDFFIDLHAGARPVEAFDRKSVLSGDAGPLDSLLAVLRLTPALLLGIAPLDRIRTPNIAGFGSMAPALLGVFLALAGVWIARGRAVFGPKLTQFKPWAVLFGTVFLVNAVIASQWGVQMLNKAEPDYTSLGRYQLWWIAALAIATALLIPLFSRLKLAVYGVLLAAFVLMTSLFLWDAQRFSISQITVLSQNFPHRMMQSARANPNLNIEMSFLGLDPAANILQLGDVGRSYPLFQPSFQRKVFEGRLRTTNPNILFNYPFDRVFYEYVTERKRNARAMNLCLSDLRRDHPYLEGRSFREIAVYLFNDQIVFFGDVKYVILHMEEDGIFFDDPRYEHFLDVDRAKPLNVFRRLPDTGPLYAGVETCLKSEVNQPQTPETPS